MCVYFQNIFSLKGINICLNYAIYLLSIYLYIYPWLYSPLLDLGRFSVSYFSTQAVGPGRGIILSQGL
jgi:hypothetical protein